MTVSETIEPKQAGWDFHHADIEELVQKGLTHGYEIEKFPESVQRALMLAAYAHEGQRRKLADMPFLAHPFETMLIVAEVQGINIETVGPGSEVEAALIMALLHDVDEDSEGRVDIAMIEGFFDARIAAGVALATRDKQLPFSAYMEKVQSSHDVMALRVVATDKSHALTCRIQELYRLESDPIDKFSVPIAEKIAYYTEIYNALLTTLNRNDRTMLMYRSLIEEYAEQVETILHIPIDLSNLGAHQVVNSVVN